MHKQRHRPSGGTLTSARSKIDLAGRLQVPLNTLVTKAEQSLAVTKRIFQGRRRVRNLSNRTQENARNLKLLAKLPGGQYPEYTKLVDFKMNETAEWPFIDSDGAYGRVNL